MHRKRVAIGRRLIIALSVIAVLLITSAQAQVVVDNIVDTSLNRYRIQFNFAGQNIGVLLLNTFYLLAVVEFTWAMVQVYLSQGGMQSFVSTIVSRSLFVGFFAWLLTRGSQTATEIFQSFEELAIASTLTSGQLSPSNILDRGQELWARLYENATAIGVFDLILDDEASLSTPVLLVFIGMLVFVIMAIIAAHFAVVLLETFIAANAGIILLALGASRWTYQYAVTYLRYAMSVGMKLFIFSIIVGLTFDEVARFLSLADISDIHNLMSLVAFILFAAVVSILAPNSIRGMMDGVSVGSAANIAGATFSAKAISSRTGQVNRLFLPK